MIVSKIAGTVCEMSGASTSLMGIGQSTCGHSLPRQVLDASVCSHCLAMAKNQRPTAMFIPSGNKNTSPSVSDAWLAVFESRKGHATSTTIISTSHRRIPPLYSTVPTISTHVRWNHSGTREWPDYACILVFGKRARQRTLDRHLYPGPHSSPTSNCSKTDIMSVGTVGRASCLEHGCG